ncbi:hypothetical protein EON82_19755 [bacterium]|nr:MAG: hypothetical protein EON82_19755 [bacterium]
MEEFKQEPRLTEEEIERFRRMTPAERVQKQLRIVEERTGASKMPFVKTWEFVSVPPPKGHTSA